MRTQCESVSISQSQRWSLRKIQQMMEKMVSFVMLDLEKVEAVEVVESSNGRRLFKVSFLALSSGAT